MRDLETTMNRRLIQRIAQVKTSGLTSVPMYRDRGELEQQEPFCLDRPSALHEWEVSRLRERVGVRIEYTDAWRDAHTYRAPHDPTPSYLEGDAGTMRFRADAEVPPALRAALDGHMAPASTRTYAMRSPTSMASTSTCSSSPAPWASTSTSPGPTARACLRSAATTPIASAPVRRRACSPTLFPEKTPTTRDPFSSSPTSAEAPAAATGFGDTDTHLAGR